MNRVSRLLNRMIRYAISWRGLIIIGVLLVWIALAAILADSVVTAALLSIGFGVAAVASITLFASDDARIRHSIAIGKRPATNSTYALDTDRRLSVSNEQILPGQSDSPAIVTVIITAWNDARFIGDAIASLKDQTIENWRCIIVDDCSTDHTLEIVFAATGQDHRFTVMINDENVGLAASRNVGIAEASTEFICFLDSDDFLYPHSLADRAIALLSYADQPWVAGVYCQWKNVAESAVPSADTPNPGSKRAMVTWLNSLRDAPFIATSPMLRKDVIEAAGGFPDVATAEDTLFWNSILRQGFIFLPVHKIGVAYRAKKVSMYRTTAVEHARLIVDSLTENSLPMEHHPFGPYPFRNASDAYIWTVTLASRLIMALASAVEAGDDEGRRIIVAVLSDTLEPYHLWELPIEQAVARAATRVCRYLPDTEMNLRKASTARTMEEDLAPLVNDLKRRATSAINLIPVGRELPRSRQVSIPERTTTSPSLLAGGGKSIVDGKVLLVPGASYHVAETGPLARELEKLGIDTVVMASDSTWNSISTAQAAYTEAVLDSVDPGDWVENLSGVVVMNDWGKGYRPIVEYANEVGVPTFAKVEGVQDFEDNDVPWERNAYRTAKVVLAQGQNDVDALQGQRTSIVSSSRLEHIWLNPARYVDDELAVVNLNFTYGVLDDARDFWMGTIAAAMRQANMRYVVSLHPKERDVFNGKYPIARDPLRYLLTKATVLVSRFSTVPFEAMARGVPFVYHNPHNESVATFLTPNGAFDITRTSEELAVALVKSRLEQDTFRDRSSAFFLRQVNVDPSQSSASRAAKVIERDIRA